VPSKCCQYYKVLNRIFCWTKMLPIQVIMVAETFTGIESRISEDMKSCTQQPQSMHNAYITQTHRFKCQFRCHPVHMYRGITVHPKSARYHQFWGILWQMKTLGTLVTVFSLYTLYNFKMLIIIWISSISFVMVCYFPIVWKVGHLGMVPHSPNISLSTCTYQFAPVHCKLFIC